MRTTIHIVSAQDYPLFAAGVAEPRRASWLVRAAASDGHDLEAEARRVRDLLRDGPKNRAELAGDLDSMTLERRRGLHRSGARAAVGNVGAAARRPLRRGRGLARSVGRPRRPTRREHLLRRYLAAFGPTTLADAAELGGMPRHRCSRPRSSGSGCGASRPPTAAELIDLPRAPLPPADTPAPSRFLGTWDAIAARARPPDAGAARGVPPARLQHEDAPLGEHVPRRRRRRRQLARRAHEGRRRRCCSSRSRRCRAARATR